MSVLRAELLDLPHLLPLSLSSQPDVPPFDAQPCCLLKLEGATPSGDSTVALTGLQAAQDAKPAEGKSG